MCATRWLEWAAPVLSTTKQWVELGTHFKIVAQADKSEKCYLTCMLSDMYADESNLLYFLFLNDISSDLTDLNNSFQKSNADITKLYSEMRTIIMSLVRRFIQPVYLKDNGKTASDAPDGMLRQNDIDIVHNALEKA